MIPISNNQVIYEGDGQTTSFPFNFKILERTDLRLIRVDKEGNETAVNNDYYVDMQTSTVYYPDYLTGGVEPEADRPPILMAGEKLIVYRDVPITQEDDMPEQWPFDVIENAMDKSCIIDQQLKGDIDRAIKFSRLVGENFDATFPIVPGKTIRVKDDGSGFETTEDPAKVYNDALALSVNVDNAVIDAQTAQANAEAAANIAATQAVANVQSTLDKNLTDTLQAKADAQNAADEAKANANVCKDYASNSISIAEWKGSPSLSEWVSEKINNGVTRFVFPKNFVLNETLTIKDIRESAGHTNNRSNSITFEGTNNNAWGGIADIILNTGGIGIKLLGTDFVCLKNLSVSATHSLATNPSTIGIVLTRDIAGSQYNFSGWNCLDNVTVQMRNNSSVNSGYGSVGIYNNTSEVITYRDIFVKANTPMILDRGDVLGVCPENTYKDSCKDHYFEGRVTLLSYGGDGSTCLLLNGAEEVTGHIYLSAIDNPASTSVGIRSIDDFVGCNLNIDCEHARYPLKIDNGYASQLVMKLNTVNAYSIIKITKGSKPTQLGGCSFVIGAGYQASYSNKYFLDIGANASISSCTFNQGTNYGYSAQINNNGAIYNSIIYGDVRTFVGSGAKQGVYFLSTKGLQTSSGNRIAYTYGAPTDDGTYKIGDICINTNGGFSQGGIYMYGANNAFYEVCQQGYYPAGTEAQIAAMTPKYYGHIVLDSSYNAYMATVLAVGGYKKIT